jgi:hypothetical protein
MNDRAAALLSALHDFGPQRLGQMTTAAIAAASSIHFTFCRLIESFPALARVSVSETRVTVAARTGRSPNRKDLKKAPEALRRLPPEQREDARRCSGANAPRRRLN